LLWRRLVLKDLCFNQILQIIAKIVHLQKPFPLELMKCFHAISSVLFRISGDSLEISKACPSHISLAILGNLRIDKYASSFHYRDNWHILGDRVLYSYLRSVYSYKFPTLKFLVIIIQYKLKYAATTSFSADAFWNWGTDWSF